MGGKTTRRGARPDRRTRRVQPHEHDPYKRRAKTAGTAVCPRCGALSRSGRWRWGAPPEGGELHRQLCPACERVRDGYPAGIVRLRGAGARRDEILARVHHVEQAEKADHPLERIMQIGEDGDEIVVTTTGIHLARRIGDALERSFHGKTTVRYPEEQSEVQVDWRAG